MLIAVCGTYGSGKSRVLSMLRECGGAVVSCDDISREIRKQPIVMAQMGDVTDVFDNFRKLHRLEGILHPLIFAKVEEIYSSISKTLLVSGTKNLYVETPILFERGYESRFSKVIGVYTDPVVLGNRLDSERMAAYLKRSRWQVGSSVILQKSDFLINNSLGMNSVWLQVTAIYSALEGL